MKHIVLVSIIIITHVMPAMDHEAMLRAALEQQAKNELSKSLVWKFDEIPAVAF